MFGFVAPTLAVAGRALPIVTKVVTHPTTVRAAVQTAIIAGTSLAVRVTQRSGRDFTAQRAAESVEKDRDPEAYSTDPRRISGLGERLRHNLIEAGTAVVEEAKSYRVVVVPFGYGFHRAMFALHTRQLHKWYEKNPDFVALAHATTEPQELDPKLLKACVRREDRYTRSCEGMARFKKWLDYHVPTAGERFLDSELVELKRLAREHEVRVDSVVNIYTSLLDEKINLNTVQFANPYAAGRELHDLVKRQFAGYEVDIVRHQVLYPWLVRYITVSDRQWKSLTKGWDTLPVDDSRKEEEQNA